jgi:two-component system chemotaxis response regulator CheB
MSTSAKRRVLVVDDSSVDRMLITHILSSDPRIEVVGAAASAEECLMLQERFRPDLIVMDVTLPGISGLEATSRIMSTQPVPIVICSGLHGTDPQLPFKSIEAGALAVLEKPAGPAHPGYAAAARNLADTVVLMSEVRVVRRWLRARKPAASSTESRPASVPSQSPFSARDATLLLIGASTGGPVALHALLGKLPKDLPVPVLIVQHIAPGFLPGMASWLQQVTGWPVRIARHGERPMPGSVYLAPDHSHMGVNGAGLIVLSSEPPEGGHRPSVSRLFRSVAEGRLASRAVAVLLTGMGVDGAAELRLLRDGGALTIAQDAESSVVHGMPGEAIRLNAAAHVLAPESIAFLLRDCGRRPLVAVANPA